MSDKNALTTIARSLVTACNVTTVKRNRAGRYVVTLDMQKLAHEAKERLGTWRAVADALGHSAAYWMLIERGERQMSRADENELRRRLHLAPKGITKIERMKTADLARYIEERRAVG